MIVNQYRKPVYQASINKQLMQCGNLTIAYGKDGYSSLLLELVKDNFQNVNNLLSTRFKGEMFQKWTITTFSVPINEDGEWYSIGVRTYYTTDSVLETEIILYDRSNNEEIAKGSKKSLKHGYYDLDSNMTELRLSNPDAKMVIETLSRRCGSMQVGNRVLYNIF